MGIRQDQVWDCREEHHLPRMLQGEVTERLTTPAASMAGGERTDPNDKSHDPLPRACSRSKPGSQTPSPSPPYPVQRTDPLPGSCLTQDHRRGASGRKRRVREHQEEQEAAGEQGRAAGAEARAHGGRGADRVPAGAGSELLACAWAGRGGDALNPAAHRLPGGPANQGPAPRKRPANRDAPPPGCPAHSAPPAGLSRVADWLP